MTRLECYQDPIYSFSSLGTCISRRKAIPRCNIIHHGIKTRTPRTLHAQKVPIAILALHLTIVTHDRNHPRQILRHGLHLNIPRPCLPRRAHGRPRHDRLFTNGTTIIEPGQVTKTMSVNGMPTRQILRTLTRREHVLATDRAVVFVLVRHAIVGIVHGDGYAHAALGAVAKVVTSPHAAETAFVAVEGTFVEGHPNVAFGTVVFGKGDSTTRACIRLARLAGIALLANNFLNPEPIHGTARRAHLIMTYPTAKHMSAAGSYHVAFTFVMYACHHFSMLIATDAPTSSCRRLSTIAREQRRGQSSRSTVTIRSNQGTDSRSSTRHWPRIIHLG
mmetsp:Transcript_8601/g.19333  ORF Transcript_8601/g.19333 Transcript_8601/m.19333 type:complete len:333 (+) Transcript_8601:195-1193(+)